jgi:hypothetical protein
MLDHIPATIVLWLLGLASTAGAFTAALKEARRQANGLGGRLNRSNELSEDRYRRISLALMSLAQTEEKKQQLLEWFK